MDDLKLKFVSHRINCILEQVINDVYQIASHLNIRNISVASERKVNIEQKTFLGETCLYLVMTESTKSAKLPLAELSFETSVKQCIMKG